jgi:RNase H-fold protein (predicted Holliday junction resolvase)
MTTSRALAAVHDMGGRTRGREGDVDQLAATVLLQTFLDHRQ